jgi:hypothetical protein
MICCCGNHAWAPLTRGYVTFVSPEDAGLLEKKWHAFMNQAGNVYAARKNRMDGSTYLHRAILSFPNGKEVDHKNLDGLDNRRENLRIASKSLNAANRRKCAGKLQFKGVYFTGRSLTKPFIARINSKHLGYFETEEKAAAAYFEAAKAQFGEFARSR